MAAEERRRVFDSQGREYWWKNGQFEPVNEVSGGEALLIGAGETFTNFGRGIKQLGFGVGEFLGVEGASDAQDDLDELVRDDAEIMAGLREEHGGAVLAGNILPSLLTGVGASGLKLGTQAAIGFAEGALSHGDAQQRLITGGLNAALVPAVPMAGRVAQSIIKNGAEIVQRGAGSSVGDFVEGTFGRIGRRRQMNIGEEVAEQEVEALSRNSVIVDDPSLTGFADDSVGAARPAGVDRPGIEPNNSYLRQVADGIEQRVDAQGGRSNEVLTQAEKQTLKTLKEQGFVIEPGMNNNNRASRLLSEAAKSDPITANTMDDLIYTPNQKKLTEKTLRALGQQGDEITDATLGNIEDRLSAQFKEVFENTPDLPNDPKFVEDLTALRKNYTSTGRHLSAEDPVMKRLTMLENAMSEGKGMPMEQLAGFRSTWRDLQRSANRTGDVPSATSYGEMVETMDDLFSRNAPEGVKDSFDQATQQWRLLTALDKGQALGRDNQIRLGTFSNNLKNSFKREFARNNRFQGEDIASTSREFLDLFESVKALNKQQSLVGNSGTATRGSINSIVTDPVGTMTKFAGRRFLRRWIKNAQIIPD